MRVTYRWLKEYVDFDWNPTELAERLTMVGHEVEGTEPVGPQYSGVVTALIERVDRHPDAEKLTVCTVFDGAERFQVVCGAPNAEAGRIAPLARVGAQLPEGKIKKGKLRGVESLGMLCSRRELGYGQDHSGLWYFPAGTPLGISPADALGLDDYVYEIAITPNRPDCLCAIGLAREVAALAERPLKKPELRLEPVGGEIDRFAKVTILDPDKCPRYTGILVRGLKIGPSPEWMVQRLEAAGLRSINNVVDITNYVLLECNQPLHAFDYSFLAGHEIIVRRARAGETITTLDEQVRQLTTDDLLICDSQKPVALAGIMGGLNSLVTDQTTDVFVESAFFEPTGIRRTSKRIGLSSESSYRFERGIDLQAVHYGLHRAARLMEEYAGGKVVPGYIDQYPLPHQAPTIEVRPERVNGLIGVELTAAKMADMLRRLELGVTEKDGRLYVDAPAFRVDLAREVDITEEVARLYGFDNVPATLHEGVDGEGREWPLRGFLRDLRRVLVGMGLTELNTISFIDPKLLAAVKAPAGLRLVNPLSEDLSMLRTSLLPSLLKSLAHNRAHFNQQVKLFETRRVYLPKGGELQPDEPYRLGILLAGPRNEVSWNQDQSEVDFYDLKGVVEGVLRASGIQNATWQRPADPGPYLPAVCAEILLGKQRLGVIGKLSADVLDVFEIKGSAFVGELDLSLLVEKRVAVPTYRPVSKFPPILRDLALVTDLETPVDEMLKAIQNTNPKRIAEVRFFDMYVGKGVPEGKKSVAFSIQYRDILKSLSDEDADRMTKQILYELNRTFGATLRE